MNYISVTELRTKSTELVDSLLAGKSVDLLYRSKVVGKVMPIVIIDEPKQKGSDFIDFIKTLKPRRSTTARQREAIYRKHLMDKYGKGISRH